MPSTTRLFQKAGREERPAKLYFELFRLPLEHRHQVSGRRQLKWGFLEAAATSLRRLRQAATSFPHIRGTFVVRCQRGQELP